MLLEKTAYGSLIWHFAMAVGPQPHTRLKSEAFTRQPLEPSSQGKVQSEPLPFVVFCRFCRALVMRIDASADRATPLFLRAGLLSGSPSHARIRASGAELEGAAS